MAENTNAMKLDLSGTLASWGVQTTFKRFSGNADAAGTGRKSGTWVAYASGPALVQPFGASRGGGGSRRLPYGLKEEEAAIMFCKTTVSLNVENRVLPTGDSYEYDIVNIDVYPTHQEVLLRRVLRT